MELELAIAQDLCRMRLRMLLGRVGPAGDQRRPRARVTVVGLTGRTGGEMCVERGFELPSRALAARHAVPAIYEVRSLLSSQ